MIRRVVSDRTLAYLRQRVQAAMTAQVRILRMVRPTMDPTSLLVTSATSDLIYTGAARIRTLDGPGPILVGEEQLTTSSVLVSVPYDAAIPHVDDIVVVDSFGPDDYLPAKALLVRDVDGGGLMRSTRTMTCTAYRESAWWEA